MNNPTYQYNLGGYQHFISKVSLFYHIPNIQRENLFPSSITENTFLLLESKDYYKSNRFRKDSIPLDLQTNTYFNSKWGS